MDEARSGYHFCDTSTVIGLSHRAAWAMGTLLGGKRPRTLTAMRAKDFEFRVAERRIGEVCLSSEEITQDLCHQFDALKLSGNEEVISAVAPE
jgi:hypothetical protein